METQSEECVLSTAEHLAYIIQYVHFIFIRNKSLNEASAFYEQNKKGFVKWLEILLRTWAQYQELF